MRTGSIPVGPTKYGVEASTVMQWTVNPPALPRLVRSQDTPPNKMEWSHNGIGADC